MLQKFAIRTTRRSLGTRKQINAPSDIVVVLDRQVLSRMVLRVKGN